MEMGGILGTSHPFSFLPLPLFLYLHEIRLVADGIIRKFIVYIAIWTHLILSLIHI